jgi:hypothetical protein
MTESARRIRFKAKLLQPAAAAKGSSWTFLKLPKTASAKLPSRGMTTVEGTINAFPFRATLEPDGQKGHWLKVNRKLREAAGTGVGDLVTLEIALAGESPLNGLKRAHAGSAMLARCSLTGSDEFAALIDLGSTARA